jgi:hypothetical protein
VSGDGANEELKLPPSKVATGKGDEGTTGLLFGGNRISKDDVRTEAYGTVDEATAALGMAPLNGLAVLGGSMVATVEWGDLASWRVLGALALAAGALLAVAAVLARRGRSAGARRGGGSGSGSGGGGLGGGGSASASTVGGLLLGGGGISGGLDAGGGLAGSRRPSRASSPTP